MSRARYELQAEISYLERGNAGCRVPKRLEIARGGASELPLHGKDKTCRAKALEPFEEPLKSSPRLGFFGGEVLVAEERKRIRDHEELSPEKRREVRAHHRFELKRGEGSSQLNRRQSLFGVYPVSFCGSSQVMGWE